MTDFKLANEVAVYNFVKEKIRQDWNLTGEQTEDYAALYDTTDGQCDLPELLLKMARGVQRTEEQAAGVAAIMTANATRRQRLLLKAEKLRALILRAMQDVGRKTLEGPDLTLSTKNNVPSVVITDERAVPKEYRKDIAEVSKTKIRHGLDEGKQFPFAEWSNAGQSLVINSK